MFKRTFSNFLKNPKINLIKTIKSNVITLKPKLHSKRMNGYLSNPQIVEITDTHDIKYNNIRLFKGKFSYLPIDDHPLIPGYTRMLSITREILEIIKVKNLENNQIVVSVCKNPELIDSVQIMQQMPINFVPFIKSHNEVYDVGCICEINIAEEKTFGVKIKFLTNFN